MKDDIKCSGCPYVNENTKKVDGINLNNKVLLVMHSPGDSENKTGRPLSGIKGSSATKIIEKLLPANKTLDDYAVVELVRCKPANGKIDEVALAICYRYLEDDIIQYKFDRIVTFCDSAFPIVKNIIFRNKLKAKVIQCKYPKNTLTKEEQNEIKKALTL